MEKDKDGEINKVNQRIVIKLIIQNKLKQLFEQNVDYQKAIDEQGVLKKKISKIDKEVIGANFEILQLNESISMAER